jgi:5-methylcytosine-specific restriction protein A
MFDPGRTYQRRELHDMVGGQRQGGISTPASAPIILLFTGESGHQYGYRDEWEPEGTYRYFGEGQVGDMRFDKGNRAIRDHALDGKDLHLFAIEPRRQGVRYVGHMVCAGSEYVSDVPDRDGRPRTAIAFRLAPIGTVAQPADDADHDTISLSTEALRRRALDRPVVSAEPHQALRTTYQRSAAVREYVLRRANGRCEGCQAPAPFLTDRGRPYLEPHHTRRLSDGGPDHPAHVIALCPNCHRRAHHAIDGEEFNNSLIEQIQHIEPAL